jgi:hypothetical protein
MRGIIPPLPQYAFMAWCSVKENTGTTFDMSGSEAVNCELLP